MEIGTVVTFVQVHGGYIGRGIAGRKWRISRASTGWLLEFRDPGDKAPRLVGSHPTVEDAVAAAGVDSTIVPAGPRTRSDRQNSATPHHFGDCNNADARRERHDAREAAILLREEAMDTREATYALRQDGARNVLAQAEVRDEQADGRDQAADRRDLAANALAFIRNDDPYGAASEDRQAAARDRSDSRVRPRIVRRRPSRAHHRRRLRSCAVGSRQSLPTDVSPARRRRWAGKYVPSDRHGVPMPPPRTTRSPAYRAPDAPCRAAGQRRTACPPSRRCRARFRR